MTAPKATAAPTAHGRSGGGARLAGATSQNASETFARDKRTIPAALPVEAIPRTKFELAAELDGLNRTRPVGVVLQPEIDDEAGPDRHGRHHKRQRAAGGRVGNRDAPPAQPVKRGEGRQHDEGKKPEHVADGAPQRRAAGKAGTGLSNRRATSRSIDGHSAKTASVARARRTSTARVRRMRQTL